MCNRAARGAGRNLALRILRRHSQSDGSQCLGDAGFTLVEMLVVLVLTAVMAAMMVGGIRQMQTWAQLEKRQYAQSALEAVADHMAGELAGALSLPLLDRDGEAFIPMAGSSDSLRFVAVIRTGFSAKALRETWYSTEASPTGTILVRKSRPHRLPRQDEISQVQSEELYKGVGKLTFGYLTRNAESNMIWLDAWATEPKLPFAVRIRISEVIEGSELNASRTVSLIN